MRSLETIIRLATAHAKLRYSKRVTMEDVDLAMKMLNETIFQENIGKRIEEENVDMESEEDNEKAKEPKNLQKQRAKPEPSSQRSPQVKKQARVDVQSEVS